MDIVLFLIEQGADDWNSGLYGACQGAHKDLVLFMIEKGANIAYSFIALTNNDILFLIQRGVTNFGRYSETEKMWRLWLQHARIELNTILISDLAGIVASY